VGGLELSGSQKIRKLGDCPQHGEGPAYRGKYGKTGNSRFSDRRPRVKENGLFWGMGKYFLERTESSGTAKKDCVNAEGLLKEEKGSPR